MHAEDEITSGTANRWGKRGIRYGASLDELRDAYSTGPMTVSFRELVGPLPADDGTHSLYPYPARLIRHIPRFLLNNDRIASADATIIDPFCGSGTVLVEAQRSGRRSHGIDSNPVAALVSRAKTSPLDSSVLSLTAHQASRSARQTRRKNAPPKFVEKWYTTQAISALSRLSHAIELTKERQTYDLLRVIFALTCRGAAQTDPRIPVPVRSQRNTGITAVDIWNAFDYNTDRVARKIRTINQHMASARVVLGDARSPSAWIEPKSASESVIVTSPPYGAAQKYVRSTSLEAGWLGFTDDEGTAALERVSVGREHLIATERWKDLNNIDDVDLRNFLLAARDKNALRSDIYANYFSDMQASIQTAVSMTPNLTTIVLIAGTNTVLGTPLPTHSYLAAMVEQMGFRCELALRDEIKGRTLLTNRKSRSAPAVDEHIYIFRSVR